MRYFNSITGQYEDDGQEIQAPGGFTIPTGRVASPDGSKDLQIPTGGIVGQMAFERKAGKDLQADMQSNPEKYPFMNMDFTSVPTGMAASPPKEMNPIVRSHIEKLITSKKSSQGSDQATNSETQRSPAVEPSAQATKPSFMDQFSDAEYQKARDASTEDNGAMAIAQLFGGIGDAFAGRSSDGTAKNFGQYRQQQKDNTVGEFERQKKAGIENYNTNRSIEQNKITDEQRLRDADVNSEESKMAQALALKMGVNPLVAKKLTAAKFKETSPVMEKMYAVEQNRLARQDSYAARSTATSEKKKATLAEVEDRRQNINANINELKNMVNEDGTFELFGSHNQDMDRLVEQIATDMAKLMDPNSVARPAEVESIKKTLVKPGFANRNSTAGDILNNFEDEVERRASTAYKVRGLDAPQGRQKAEDSEPGKQSGSSFPRQISKGGKVATVSNAAELREAQSEGWK